MHHKKINISKLGIKEVDEAIWFISFMHYDLGYIDLDQRVLQPLDNPFDPGLSHNFMYVSVTNVLRAGRMNIGERGGTRTLDPMIKSHVLYHLSYALTCRAV
jgi:hypothetical protein